MKTLFALIIATFVLAAPTRTNSEPIKISTYKDVIAVKVFCLQVADFAELEKTIQEEGQLAGIVLARVQLQTQVCNHNPNGFVFKPVGLVPDIKIGDSHVMEGTVSTKVENDEIQAFALLTADELKAITLGNAI